MSHQVIWTKIVVEEFVRLANLSKIEEEILRTRASYWTVEEQCTAFNMSRSSVNRVIKRLKCKYDAVQPYSTLLPPRKFSSEETYMDTH